MAHWAWKVHLAQACRQRLSQATRQVEPVVDQFIVLWPSCTRFPSFGIDGFAIPVRSDMKRVFDRFHGPFDFTALVLPDEVFEEIKSTYWSADPAQKHLLLRVVSVQVNIKTKFLQRATPGCLECS